jgi:hypothetical protein
MTDADDDTPDRNHEGRDHDKTGTDSGVSDSGEPSGNSSEGVEDSQERTETREQDGQNGSDRQDIHVGDGQDSSDDVATAEGGDTTASEDGNSDDPAMRDTDATDGMEGEPDIRLEDVDRVFSLIEHALGSDTLEGRQFDRLLSVLERAVADSSETDPETIAEFVTLLEELIIEPDDLEEVDVDGSLSILEETLAQTTGGQWAESDDVLEVMTEAIRDPTKIDPNDVERFRSGVESAIVEMTGSQGLGQLFSFPETVAEPDAEMGDGEVDMFRIARLAAGMTQRATGYSLESGIRTGTRMAYAATNAQSPAQLVTETRAITLDELQRTGIDVGAEQSEWLERHEDEVVHDRPVTRERLREQGEKLLSKSAELGHEESVHPAFSSILHDLSPDEARLLRLLATEGPQPSLDVYDKMYVPFKTNRIAENLTRMGSDAGCREPARTPLYIQNLTRLGLVTVRDDPVEDLKRYQVLEAQPHIEAAREEAKRPKTTYGAVHLTDFGIEFCETCLPVTVEGHRRSSRFWEDS